MSRILVCIDERKDGKYLLSVYQDKEPTRLLFDTKDDMIKTLCNDIFEGAFTSEEKT